MVRSLHATVKHIARNVFHTANRRARKRMIIKFADKTGLLYFGTVSQHSDDQRIVRGFTVSSSHQDNHYSVGSINGYDVTLVDRSDALWQPDGSIATHNWLIMAFDLRTKQDIPHFFLSARNHDQKPYMSLFTTFHTMKEVNLGTFEEYSPEFTSRFSIYTQPSTSIEVERLFPADTTRILGAHFWPLSAEQNENILYIYADNAHVTPSLLDTMIEDGLWLAGHLDRQAELI